MILPVLRDSEIDLTCVTPAEGASGIALILVGPEGTNSIVVVPGANGRLVPADIEAARDTMLAAGVILTQLETSRDVCVQRSPSPPKLVCR